jgi:hypothetical protein
MPIHYPEPPPDDVPPGPIEDMSILDLGSVVQEAGQATMTLSNVTVRAGAALIVSVARTLPSSTPTAPKWGTTTMSVAYGTGGMFVYYLLNQANETHDIVLTWGATKPTLQILMAADVLLPKLTAADFTLITNLGTGTDGVEKPSDNAFTWGPLHLVWVTLRTLGPVTDAAGTWQGATGIQRAGSPTQNLTLDVGALLQSSLGDPTVGKTGMTSRAWTLAAQPFVYEIPVTGATTYATGTIDRKFDLEGRGPTPAVKARIWSRHPHHRHG